MGHLDSQPSLPVFGERRPGFSSTAKKLRLAAGQRVAILTADQLRRDGSAAIKACGAADSSFLETAQRRPDSTVGGVTLMPLL
ncbi:MAG: hypothetical protein ACYDB4_19315 [Candidatus Dormibacteraceae bacterium]